MSKYHNDATYASNPGRLEISEAMLRALEPELFTASTMKCGPTCPVDHPVAEMRERIAEHMKLGDRQPAVVVSIDPLVVAVESIDLDAAALLRFPLDLVARLGLNVGTRLLSVNTYGDLRRQGDNERFYAVDLIPGPARSGWSNFSPIIADFVSDDAARIAGLRDAIPDEEWARLESNAKLRIDRLGLATARDGRPTRSATPVPIDGTAMFKTLDGSPFVVAPAAAAVSAGSPRSQRTSGHMPWWAKAIETAPRAVAAVCAALAIGLGVASASLADRAMHRPKTPTVVAIDAAGAVGDDAWVELTGLTIDCASSVEHDRYLHRVAGRDETGATIVVAYEAGASCVPDRARGELAVPGGTSAAWFHQTFDDPRVRVLRTWAGPGNDFIGVGVLAVLACAAAFVGVFAWTRRVR